MNKYKVLSTKKLRSSLIAKILENNIVIAEKEFISIHSLWNEEIKQEVNSLSDRQYIVFTSSNAVNIVGAHMNEENTFINSWKVFCLSGKTKNLVLKFENFSIAGDAENAGSLAEKIIESGVKEVVFFCGNKRRNELPDILQSAGVKLHEIVVYETLLTPLKVNDDFEAILFFSPSSVESFFSLNKLKERIVCFAVGSTTCNSIISFCSNEIIVSEAPGEEMMLNAVNNYFHKYTAE